MTESQPIATTSKHKSVLVSLATKHGMEAKAFEATLRATVVPKGCSKEQFAAFALVANEYNLNPLTKEIYAFPAKGGGITPIVGIDGWMKLINTNPNFEGIEFHDNFDGDKLVSIKCVIFRNDRTKSISVTEYMDECFRPTEPWKKWPKRMLRHKAAIQCARYAFGFAGIVDEDEYARGEGLIDVTPPPEEKPVRGQSEQETATNDVEDVNPETGEIAEEKTKPEPEQKAETKQVKPSTKEELEAAYNAGQEAFAKNRRQESGPREPEDVAKEWVQGFVDAEIDQQGRVED